MALNAFIGGGGKDRETVKYCDQRGKKRKKELVLAFHDTS